MFLRRREKKGFTLIELLIVVAIISVLLILIISSLSASRRRVNFVRSVKEFRTFETAMNFYLNENGNTYPPDVSRNIPSGMEEYLGGGEWPTGPYADSVYDWDNITGSDPYIQISLRFCEIDGSNCNFPDEPWAVDFDAQSSLYWCFEGECRSHPARPVSHPGYCVNCQ